MKLKSSFLVLLLLMCFAQIETRHRLKGGKIHQRSKRTIGEIINWKLNILQSIFGGIFGGGKKKPSGGYGAPKPSYGAQRPQRPGTKPRPNYNAPQRPGGKRPGYNAGNPKRPNYNGQKKPSYSGGRPNVRPRPSQNQRPNYNNAPSSVATNSQQQFGPANVFKMLPAPNLATAAPQTGSRPTGINLGSPSLDTYGSPAAAEVSVQATISAQDSYGSPQAPAVSGGEDSYGSPIGNPISTPDSYRSAKVIPPLPSSNSYSAPVNPSKSMSFSSSLSGSSSTNSNNDNSAIPVLTTYGSGVKNAFGPLIIQDNSGDSYSAPDSPVVIQGSSVVSQSGQESSPAPASDSYGGAIAPVIIQADTPSSVASNPSQAPDSYGGALAPVIRQADSVSSGLSISTSVSASDSDGGALAPELSDSNPASDSYNGAISSVNLQADLPQNFKPAPAEPGSYSLIEDVDPVIVASDAPFDPQIAAVLPKAAGDSYGSPQSNVLTPQVDMDDYDPNDVPADQAAPLPSYGSSEVLDIYGQSDSFADDYDPNDIPPDQAADPIPSYGSSDSLDSYGGSASPIISDNSLGTGPQQTFDVYGSALAPVGTSAPVPDEIFTVDSKAPTSFDSYNPQSNVDSQSQSVTNDNGQTDVIDLTEPQADAPQFAPAIEQLPDLTVTDVDLGSDEIVTPVSIQDAVIDEDEPASYEQEPLTASLLPPVIANVVDSRSVDAFVEDLDESVTPTSAPVLFTYAPVEGSTFDDLQPQLNIVVQNDEDGSSLSDPLNVIPDEYEDLDYDSDYDPKDVPLDQAEPLDSYGNQDLLDSYNNNEISSLNEIELQDIDGPAPSPAFEDLRGIEFTTGVVPSLDDPQPTTYRSPIDFDLGTTAGDGIEVGNVVTSVEEVPDYFDNSLATADEIDREELSQPLYSDEYEAENETEYSPKNQNIPIVVEESATKEALPSYEPVVLLVGTPEKKDEASTEATDLPLYENSLERKTPRKRKANGKKKKTTLKQRYNNWFGPRNDWSRRIQRVQGRIRYKKQNQKKS